ncbi:MAG: hypothetical protein V2B17_02950 [Chloroflexota bacterium]
MPSAATASASSAAAWLTRGELAAERVVTMMRAALEIAFDDRPRDDGVAGLRPDG